MGMRFRKSVKICKGVKVNFSKSGASVSLGGRGHSVNVGKRGTRATVGIPGTGLSYSTKVSGGKKKKSAPAKSRSTNNYRASNNAVSTPGQVELHMNEKGQITIVDGNGYEITDQAVLRKIKATPQFKAMKDQLEMQRQEKIDEIIRTAEEENEQYLNIYESSAVVDSAEQFLKRLNSMEPERYIIEEYDIMAPSEAEVRNTLMEEAKENVKASIFTAGKLRRQYVEERIGQRLAQAVAEWEEDKNHHYQEQEEIKRERDADFDEEYEAERNFLSLLIDGDDTAVSEVFDEWISSCELPVEMNIDYDWNQDIGVLMLDVDLPEIEDLPDTRMTKTSAGNLKEKKKTQAELRGEYATLVFGLAIFVASNAFNTSPAIKKILISGYTQRRDKAGCINDDYIYSLKFKREQFENRNLSMIVPKEFCMLFENRCNMTSTALFKTIKPFDEF